MNAIKRSILTICLLALTISAFYPNTSDAGDAGFLEKHGQTAAFVSAGACGISLLAALYYYNQEKQFEHDAPELEKARLKKRVFMALAGVTGICAGGCYFLPSKEGTQAQEENKSKNKKNKKKKKQVRKTKTSKTKKKVGLKKKPKLHKKKKRKKIEEEDFLESYDDSKESHAAWLDDEATTLVKFFPSKRDWRNADLIPTVQLVKFSNLRNLADMRSDNSVVSNNKKADAQNPADAYRAQPVLTEQKFERQAKLCCILKIEGDSNIIALLENKSNELNKLAPMFKGLQNTLSQKKPFTVDFFNTSLQTQGSFEYNEITKEMLAQTKFTRTDYSDRKPPIEVNIDLDRWVWEEAQEKRKRR